MPRLDDDSSSSEGMLSLGSRKRSTGSLSITPLTYFLQQTSLTQQKDHAILGGSGTNAGTTSSRMLEDDELIEVECIAPSIVRSLMMAVLALLLTSGCCCVNHLVFARKAQSVLICKLTFSCVAAFLSFTITCAVTFDFASNFHHHRAPLLETWHHPMPQRQVSDRQCGANDAGMCCGYTNDSKISTCKVVGLCGLSLTIQEGYNENHPIAFSKQAADFFDVLFPNNFMQIFVIQESLSIFTFASIIGMAIVKTHEVH